MDIRIPQAPHLTPSSSSPDQDQNAPGNTLATSASGPIADVSSDLAEILIIRHAERADQVPSDPWHHSEQPRPKDTPLTLHGKIHARRQGRRLREFGVRAKVIYCSPMLRCIQTACEIAHELQLPIQIVYSLAKPCHHFRSCARLGIAPQFTDREEAEEVLRQRHPDVKLMGFLYDDGTNSRGAMERIVHLSKDSQSEAYPQTIFVSHCEAQKEMAIVAGLKKRMEVPYCGVAIFDLQRQANVFKWSLRMTPRDFE